MHLTEKNTESAYHKFQRFEFWVKIKVRNESAKEKSGRRRLWKHDKLFE